MINHRRGRATAGASSGIFAFPGLVRPPMLIFLMLIAAPWHPAGLLPAQSNPLPLINQPLIPVSAAPGGPDFTLTVNGTGFVPGAVVNWNGGPRSTTFVSSSQLTAVILAHHIATPSTPFVTVTNPGLNRTSNVVFFPVTEPIPVLAFSAVNFPVAGNPESLTVADFNGDRKPDLAVTNTATSSVSILLGNGDGTFQARQDFATGNAPVGVAAGDFNGDGKPDLAVADASGVSILRGNGDGTFQTAMHFAAGLGSFRLAVGDFNGDGTLDVAVTNGASNGTVSVLLGNGDGTLQAHRDFVTGGVPESVVAGDFNGDGKLDLATANAVGSVSILSGNGDGTFQTSVDYPAGQGAEGVVIADFNGDGKLDLATANNGAGSGTASILLGNGDGTFQSAVDYPVVCCNPNAVVAGDFNGDGKIDLAVGSISLLLGNGDGTFQPHMDFTPNGADDLVAGDFNGDGRLDLATAIFTQSVVAVVLQTTASITPSSLTFPTQLKGTASKPQTATLTNIGASPITITRVAITGTDHADFKQTNTCGSVLSSGGSCALNVNFKPTRVNGRSANLSVTDDAPGSPQSILLVGTGTIVKLVPGRLNFGSVVVGHTSAAQMVTVTNVGVLTLMLNSIGVTGMNPADYSETNTCGGQLAARASCTVTMTFTPMAKGSRTVSIAFTDNGGGSPQTVPVIGKGI